eukprot:CAMPEP_0202902914 /NCGR_PEP_ID=MMETSP1392-20130828/18766_1 /ASSEMBLY_ACC=CAM_ASM_000868 /TAXON_ID=225041 /ORGANISM="Chlamydomonas chlamydogama, Strain SAG 11-48b" /LENGTH=173 /DNA_ID=CAMNT_0049589775 /DNA_START=834 /DNA_END=1357 /DNA_ORIENTATION=-
MPSEVCTSNEPGRPSPCSFPSTTTEGNAASIASAAAMNTSTSSGSYSMVTVLGGARPRPADHAMWRAPEVGPDTLGVEKKGVGKVRGMKPAWAAVLARLVPAVLDELTEGSLSAAAQQQKNLQQMRALASQSHGKEPHSATGVTLGVGPISAVLIQEMLMNPSNARLQYVTLQ